MRRFRKMLKQMDVAPPGGIVMGHRYGLLEKDPRVCVILAVVRIRRHID